MDPDFVFKAPGLVIEAWRFGGEEELPFIGVLVEFDGIPKEARPIALEAAMRHWQRSIGMVRRGGRGDLAGWRVHVFQECRIARIRLSYQPEESSEADG